MPDSPPSPSRDFQIYLSSTLDDLVDERKAAIESFASTDASSTAIAPVRGQPS